MRSREIEGGGAETGTETEARPRFAPATLTPAAPAVTLALLTLLPGVKDADAGAGASEVMGTFDDRLADTTAPSKVPPLGNDEPGRVCIIFVDAAPERVIA